MVSWKRRGAFFCANTNRDNSIRRATRRSRHSSIAGLSRARTHNSGTTRHCAKYSSAAESGDPTRSHVDPAGDTATEDYSASASGNRIGKRPALALHAKSRGQRCQCGAFFFVRCLGDSSDRCKHDVTHPCTWTSSATSTRNGVQTIGTADAGDRIVGL